MEGEEFSAAIRMREVESLKEAGRARAGIRVLVGTAHRIVLHVGSHAGGHRDDGARRTRSREDHERGSICRNARTRGSWGRARRTWAFTTTAIEAMETDWKIAQAKRAEEVAFATDPRIQNSEGASFDSYVGRRVFVNSRGFSGSYRTSSCGLSVSPVAKQNGSMERDYWYTSARAASKLESPRRGRPARRGARRAPLESAKNRDAESCRSVRAAHRAVAAGRSVRCGERRCHLSSCVIPRRQAGRENRRRFLDRGRRSHVARTFRQPVRSTTKE